MNEQRAGATPLFTIGQKLMGAEYWKYATAISPDRRNAIGRVKSPNRRNAPPTTSRTPAIQNSEKIAAVAPFGGMPIGNANSFIPPAWRKMNAVKMRRTLSNRGAQLDHFATTFVPFMGISP